MKWAIASMLLFSSVDGNEHITGSWNWIGPSRDADDVPEATLSLNVRMRGSRVYGSSCYIHSFGNRIDCPMQMDDCNLSGTYNNGQAEVIIRYEYLGTDHAAKLVIDDDKLKLTSETYADPWATTSHGG